MKLFSIYIYIYMKTEILITLDGDKSRVFNTTACDSSDFVVLDFHPTEDFHFEDAHDYQ